MINFFSSIYEFVLNGLLMIYCVYMLLDNNLATNRDIIVHVAVILMILLIKDPSSTMLLMAYTLYLVSVNNKKSFSMEKLFTSAATIPREMSERTSEMNRLKTDFI